MSLSIVETKYGKVRGVAEEGVINFKGIPYAAPPVGELRWKPPVDPEPWEGVRPCLAYAFRPVADMGTGEGYEPYTTDFCYMGLPRESEDCLYLNVATAAEKADEKRPVYVWFHGGGLSTGYSYEVEFNPNVLAKKGIVMVSVGQRLNVFGYLALPQLSAEQGGTSGNYGLMDEVKALEWVYENIAAFGGDPENITIGGQSGGTAKTGTLATCPLVQGKIKRVINQSSLNWTGEYKTVKEGEQEGLAYIKSLGFPEDVTIEELRKADTSVFRIPNERIMAGPGQMYCDGIYVPYTDRRKAVEQYSGSVCDFLIGNNFGEGFLVKNFGERVFEVDTKEKLYARVKELLGEELYDKYDVEKLVPVDENTDIDVLSRRLASLGLNGFSSEMKNRWFGALRAKKNPELNTYSYLFSRVPPAYPEDYGTVRDPKKLMAWHSSELWYVFSSLRQSVPPCRPWEDKDFELADVMSSYWANFMKTGNPNGEGLPYWPKSGENLGWIELGNEITAHEGMEDKLDELFLDYVKANLEE